MLFILLRQRANGRGGGYSGVAKLHPICLHVWVWARRPTSLPSGYRHSCVHAHALHSAFIPSPCHAFGCRGDSDCGRQCVHAAPCVFRRLWNKQVRPHASPCTTLDTSMVQRASYNQHLCAPCNTHACTHCSPLGLDLSASQSCCVMRAVPLLMPPFNTSSLHHVSAT